jgi:hypothetical protein
MSNSTARFGSELCTYVPAQNRREQFRPQDVEMLLDQAADLLDRIQRDTTEQYGLEERLAGIEDLALEKNVFDKTVDMAPSLDQEIALSTVPKEDPSFPNVNVTVLAMEALALEAERLSHRKHTEILTELKQVYETPPARQAESLAVKAASAVAGFMADALAIKKKEVEELTQLRKKIRDIKVARSQADEDAFNFAERRANLRLKLSADGKEAKDRLVQAQTGLRLYYNIGVVGDAEEYGKNDPSLTDELFDIEKTEVRPKLSLTHFLSEDKPDEPVKKPRLMNEYDALHFWTRRAISKVARIVRRDQLFSIPVSVKAHLGEAWHADGKTWVLGNIPGLNRDRHSLIRLRGLSVSIVTKSGTVPDSDCWTGTITCTSPPLKSPLPVFLGRVRPANVLREDEIFGAVMLHNVDPFLKQVIDDSASWEIELAPASIRGVLRSDAVIDDVLVTFRVVAQVI